MRGVGHAGAEGWQRPVSSRASCGLRLDGSPAKRGDTPARFALSVLVNQRGAHQSPELGELAPVVPIVRSDARSRPTGRNLVAGLGQQTLETRSFLGTSARAALMIRQSRSRLPNPSSKRSMSAREIYTTVRRVEAAKRQNPQEGQQRSVSIGYALPGIRPEKDPGEQLYPVTSLPGRLGQVDAHLAHGSNEAPQSLPVLASRVKSGAPAERTLEALPRSPGIRTLRPQWAPASSLPKSAGDALALRSCATSSSQRRPSSEPPVPSLPVLPVEVAPRTQTARASAGACVHCDSAGRPGISRPPPSWLPSARRSPP